MNNALILVDLQNDFLPGGALAVSNGDMILNPIQDLLKMPFDVKIATKDWHPKNHGSFATTHGLKPLDHIKIHGMDQILWPEHCVQNSYGAEISEKIDIKEIDKVIHKGVNKDVDSYSAFFDNEHIQSTGLYDYLKEKEVDTVYIAGLATDYCVKYSALDALKLGFKTFVLTDCCHAVNLHKEDERLAFEEMKNKGITLIDSKTLKLP